MPSEANARTIRPEVMSNRSVTRERGSSSGIEWANEIVPSWKTAARPPASRSMASKPPARAAATASA